MEDQINRHLANFGQFAGLFTKVIVPIVDTAVKMSSDEPVSAYGFFQAAAENKKSKKNQNEGSKNKNKKKTPNKKVSNLKAPKSSGKKKANKLKTQNANVKQKEKEIVEHKNASEPEDTVNPADQFQTDEGKKLTKVEQKKKKDLAMGDAAERTGRGSFESDCSADTYTGGSDSLAGEYYIDGGISFSEDESYEDESFSTTNEGDLAQAIVPKANKKRKSEDGDTSSPKAKSNSFTEVKKSKNIEDAKTSRKSLPVVKAIKDLADHPDMRRTTIASVYDLNKKSSSKGARSKVSVASKVKLEAWAPPVNVVKLNSIEEGKRAFQWLLNPVAVDCFFDKFWEKRPLLVRRRQENYFSKLISFQTIDQMLLRNHVEFTKNIDVTSYKNGVRETLNPEGRALPPAVWGHYGQGCSIRLLNPQTFLKDLHGLCAIMQEYFHCLVGANAYLTPPNSQGFAPHYDDIEAFVVQVEGRKLWKLYKPRSTAETLPRFSSKNFTQEEIGEPVLETVLEPGDVLYFPRGTIHQALTEPGYHSLHVTLSVYQKQSFADLFEKMLPIMMQKAIASNVDLRRGLPLNAWRHAGIVYSDCSSKERDDLIENVTKLMQKCVSDMPLHSIIDAGIDQMAKKFQHEALPPQILPAEKLHTIFGSRSHTTKRGECVCDYDIDERANVRLLRANILRLVDEENKLRIYYHLDNSKEYCEYEPNFIEIEAKEAASVETLIKSYPQYVGVAELPLSSDEEKIDLVTALWERGLLMMQKPFR